MDCKQISGHLIDYIDLKLDNNTAKIVEKHIAGCENCEKEYVELNMLFDKIKSTEEVQPDVSLKNNFMQILADEKRQQKKQIKTKVVKLQIPSNKILWQTAAAIALLITGFLAGYQFNNDDTMSNVQSNQLAEMKSSVDEMKKMMVFNLLKNESASQRIKAVNYTEELSKPDSKIIKALIKTLNSDKNTNVRLAAVYSLARFKTNESVKNALIETLNKQDDPMIQIVIINMLVEMEEVKAVDELQHLLKNKDLNEQVKQQAEMGVEVLS